MPKIRSRFDVIKKQIIRFDNFMQYLEENCTILETEKERIKESYKLFRGSHRIEEEEVD